MPPKAKGKAKTAANPVGRPSKYDPAYCDLLEAFMGEGYSATAFAGHIGVNRQTIDNWAKDHAEFFEALTCAKAKRLLHWEKTALTVAKDGGGPGSASVITFGLRNMGDAEWADVQRSEVTGKDGGPIQSESRLDLTALTEDQLRALASIKLSADA